MLLKKALSAAAIGLALVSAMPAQASTITNTDGTFSFTGFDWSSNGTAFTTGFVPVAGATFQLEAFTLAVTLKNGPFDILGLKLDSNADGVSAGAGFYEYTLHLTLQETVDSCTSGGGSTACTFTINSGAYDIFYDTTPDANALAGSLGTGYLDGIKVISGSIFPQSGGTFTVAGTGGSGITAILGSVDFTNLAFINPALTSTVAGTTLQFGTLTTNNYVSPGGFNGVAFGTEAGGTFVFQADANQSFAVPEPASLALFGLAILAGGAASRRRIKDKK